MKGCVSIVDYGVGNLLSVTRAVAAAGGNSVLARTAEDVARAECLLLPGVGAFGHCMDVLRARGLIQSILDFAATGRPFLGICVGMQILLDEGTEFGTHRGLGLIPGRVLRIPDTDAMGLPQKVPFVGWNRLLRPAGRPDWTGTILEGLEDGAAWTYFTHSYVAFPERNAHQLAEATYFGRRLTAAVARDNVVGCQFHPEKSGPVGLGILARFIGSA